LITCANISEFVFLQMISRQCRLTGQLKSRNRLSMIKIAFPS